MGTGPTLGLQPETYREACKLRLPIAADWRLHGFLAFALSPFCYWLRAGGQRTRPRAVVPGYARFMGVDLPPYLTETT